MTDVPQILCQDYRILYGTAGMTVWAIEDSYSSAMRKEKEALADAFLESYDEISLEAFV